MLAPQSTQISNRYLQPSPQEFRSRSQISSTIKVTRADSGMCTHSNFTRTPYEALQRQNNNSRLARKQLLKMQQFQGVDFKSLNTPSFETGAALPTTTQNSRLTNCTNPRYPLSRNHSPQIRTYTTQPSQRQLSNNGQGSGTTIAASGQNQTLTPSKIIQS